MIMLIAEPTGELRRHGTGAVAAGASYCIIIKINWAIASAPRWLSRLSDKSKQKGSTLKRIMPLTRVY